MGYYIRCEEIYEYYDLTKNWCERMKVILGNLEKNLIRLSKTQSMRGESAEGIQNYIKQFYLRIIPGIRVVLESLESNLRHYTEEYQINIDGAEDAVFCEDAFSEYIAEMEKQMNSISYFHEQIEMIIRNVDFADIRKPGVYSFEEVNHGLTRTIQSLAEDVAAMESQHAGDTQEAEELASMLSEFMQSACFQPVKGSITDTANRIAEGDAWKKIHILTVSMEQEIKEIQNAGGVEYVTREMLRSCGWENVSDEMLENLNRVLYKYEINTPERILHFLVQCSYESEYGRAVVENGDEEYFEEKEYNGKYIGGGYLQMTWDYNYTAFATYLILEKYPQLGCYGSFRSPASNGRDVIIAEYNNIVAGAEILNVDIEAYTNIVAYGAAYVGDNYAWESAGFIWEINELNEAVDNGRDVHYISSIIVGGKVREFPLREEIYEAFLERNIFSVQDV